MLYAVGGASEVDEYGTSTAECYDPVVDMWYMIKPLPAYLTQHAGATYEHNLDLKLFISGGMDRDSIQSSMFCYTVGNDQWQQCAPMIRARADHVMLSKGGFLYVCGGWTEGADGRSRVLVDTIDVYDIKKDCWEVLTTVPTPRYHAGIVCVDCKIYFIGGFYSDDMFDKSTAAIECYDIEAQTWATEEKYPQDIWEHTCASLFIPKWRDDMQDMQVIAKMENA